VAGETKDEEYSKIIQDYFSIEQKTKDSERTIKFCLYPDRSRCRGKLIKAHAIQNNRILSKLAEKGMLIAMDGRNALGQQYAHPIGRGITSTFTGFCQYHDKNIFQEIEDVPFLCSEKQIFLLSYRTFSWAFMKKLQQAKRNATRDRLHHHNQLPFTKANYQGCIDNAKQKVFFDHCLLTNNYHVMGSAIWILDYQIAFAVSSMLELDYGIDGKPIDPEHTPNYEHSIYLNIFPDDKKSYCIWSWRKEDKSYYDQFGKDFLALSTEDKKNYLNFNLPILTDAIFISPRLWNKWNEETKNVFVQQANLDQLFELALEAGYGRKYEHEVIPWDLFENL
jgi:hypothetical protein